MKGRKDCADKLCRSVLFDGPREPTFGGVDDDACQLYAHRSKQ